MQYKTLGFYNLWQLGVHRNANVLLLFSYFIIQIYILHGLSLLAKHQLDDIKFKVNTTLFLQFDTSMLFVESRLLILSLLIRGT